MGFGQARWTSDRRPDTRREANVLRPKNRSTDQFLNWSNFQAHWIDFGCVKLHLLSLRDKLAQGILKRLFWSDTRDMVADGLTKGGVNRALIKSVSDAGRLVLEHKCLVCSRVNTPPQ